MKDKVLVFGGSGFIGSYVVNELVKRDYNVQVADIKPSPYFDEKLFRKCDILDKHEVNRVIDDDFAFIYNFAGFANLDKAIDHPLDTMMLNVIGNAHIMEAFRQTNIKRYIFASSSYALSDKGSFYGISKLTSEKVIAEYHKRYGVPYTIIRYGSVYGDREYDNNYIYNLVKNALLTHTITHDGDGEEVREYIHAYDAATLSVDIIEDEKFTNEHLILTGFERMKRIELFEMIKEIVNQNIIINLRQDGYGHHYKMSPYSYQPESSKKLISNPFVDIGQGILDCIQEINRKLQEESSKDIVH